MAASGSIYTQGIGKCFKTGFRCWLVGYLYLVFVPGSLAFRKPNFNYSPISQMKQPTVVKILYAWVDKTHPLECWDRRFAPLFPVYCVSLMSFSSLITSATEMSSLGLLILATLGLLSTPFNCVSVITTSFFLFAWFLPLFFLQLLKFKFLLIFSLCILLIQTFNPTTYL